MNRLMSSARSPNFNWVIRWLNATTKEASKFSRFEKPFIRELFGSEPKAFTTSSIILFSLSSFQMHDFDSVESGDLILFPSYLHHDVPMNESDEDRISIAFNCLPSHISVGFYEVDFKVKGL